MTAERDTATVETLTASVRVLMVGNRRVGHPEDRRTGTTMIRVMVTLRGEVAFTRRGEPRPADELAVQVLDHLAARLLRIDDDHG